MVGVCGSKIYKMQITSIVGNVSRPMGTLRFGVGFAKVEMVTDLIQQEAPCRIGSLCTAHGASTARGIDFRDCNHFFANVKK